MSDIQYEEALAHFGVKGMRWGQRKATSDGGGGVLRRRASTMTQDRIESHQKALSGKGVVGTVAKLDKYTWGGSGRFEGYHNKRISELERSQERIAKGELVATTILWGPQYSKLPKS